MPDESDAVPASRIVRWIAVGALIAFAVGLYFRDGRRLPPLTAAPSGRQIGVRVLTPCPPLPAGVLTPWPPLPAGEGELATSPLSGTERGPGGEDLSGSADEDSWGVVS